MDLPKKVLFFTNSDYGQANVILATAHTLLLTQSVEIHIASFHGLEAAVRSMSNMALSQSSTTGVRNSIVFHSLQGISWGPASFRPETGVAASLDLKPGLRNSAACVSRLPTILLPWHPDEFMTIYREAERILEEVNPNLTIVEPLFTQAMTLCHRSKVNWAVLAPNTIKDFAIPKQPNLAMLWKYPLVCSAMPYPLPWALIPRNIALNLVAGYALVTDTRIKEITRILHHEVDPTVNLITANELGVLKSPPPGIRILVANSPDLDYHFDFFPDYIVPCGPIIRPTDPVAAADPDLAAWLDRGPTVYVNLGTHLKATPTEATEMAHAYRAVLDYAREHNLGPLQILWKIGRKHVDGEKLEQDNFDGSWKPVLDTLRPELDAGRMRLTDWVTVEPGSVLQSGRIVCSIHHGGASSFYEALCAGIPQILLPPWSDCYDFANRTELLGVGRWANKKAKPRWERSELASCIIDVLFGPESTKILARAKAVAAQHPEGAGREKAAREIIALVA
ncbi:hypothetical protein jhhlp_000171 [Lomentospora prolificans]|uniref:Erythromycin biosynthesis protein CIII-like C-terminal domain-containing protein n=1 Tax=Lomentospora prolificans TaxID=41688 RepID=A0A2N3NLT1_9PEZI|nr:hypothetical protein jhhlp_000171 [Lomentospora prolificans]